MRLQFSTASQIYFGEGILWELVPAIVSMGMRVMVVTGEYVSERLSVIDHFRNAGCDTQMYLVEGEPNIGLIDEGVRLSRSFRPDTILALGGGSAIDTAKAISGLTANPGHLIDYLEVIGSGMPLRQAGPSVIAVPTTAGTGAEVTRNAVIGVSERRVKVSLRSPHLLPRMAIVDPTLTHNLPRAITAYSGMDALVQLIEAYLSNRSNAMTDLFCREGIVRASHALPTVYHDGKNARSREDMSFASLLGGLALANAGLGAVHGFAGPIGGMYLASHGAICARLLSPVLARNYMVLQANAPDSHTAIRFREVAGLLLGPNATVTALTAWIDNLCAEMNIPRLRDLGVRKNEFPEIIEQSAVASSMRANPVVLNREDLHQILTDAW
jgi:alcohol dehydrogenase class IV